MGLDVHVALIANAGQPFEPGPIDDSFYAQPYAERRKVTISVQEQESLASVLERAAALMGLQPPADSWTGGRFDASHRKIAFYKPEDDEGPVERPQGRLMLGELVLVDRDGRAIFGVHDLRTVGYDDLLGAAEAGAIDGDPLKPYLILDEGWGDVPPVDWATVQEGFDVAWEVIKALAVVTGATTGGVKAKQWLTERLARGRDALAANPEWSQRGYRPDQFVTLLSTRDWNTADLARLLGCSEQEAEAVLWALGYVFSEGKSRWQYRADNAGTMLSTIIQAIGYAAHQGGPWQSRFRAWLVRYLEEGEPSLLETLDLESTGDASVPPYNPTVGERIDDLLARLRAGRFRGL